MFASQLVLEGSDKLDELLVLLRQVLRRQLDRQRDHRGENVSRLHLGRLFALERPSYVRFMMTRGLQPSDDAELAQINEKVSRRVREMVLQAGVDLREAMEIGEIPPAPIDELAVMLFALWNGMAGLVVRADETAIPSELAWRALERSRVLLRRAVAHEFEHPGEAPLASWERPADA